MVLPGILGSAGGIPGTPTIGTATAGNTQATVAFTTPTYTGKGGTVTYRAISSPGNIQATSTTSPITVTGLTNGTAYTFQVRAETSYGINGAYSASSNSVTPVVPNYALVSTFNASGNYTIPSGITSLAVAGVGAGGGGYGGFPGDSQQGGAGSPSGASFIYRDYTVKSGDVINVTIGAGGNGGSGNGTTGNAGGITYVKINTNTTLITANGGSSNLNVVGNVTSNMTVVGTSGGNIGGGGAGTRPNPGTAGTAQNTVTSNITGISSYSGGGGGGGGGVGGVIGSSGTAGGGGGSPYGGSGGSGGNTSKNFLNAGNAGASASGPGGGGGGGGGGAFQATGCGQYSLGGNGGNGAAGQILIYTK